MELLELPQGLRRVFYVRLGGQVQSLRQRIVPCARSALPTFTLTRLAAPAVVHVRQERAPLLDLHSAKRVLLGLFLREILALDVSVSRIEQFESMLMLSFN
jgi:hypothetical protein